MDDRICDHCGRWIERNETRYAMTITLQADPGPEIELPEPAEDVDLLEEIQRLVESMEEMSPDQVQEATEQVHESYRFSLCPECRGEMHRRMRRRTRILDVE